MTAGWTAEPASPLADFGAWVGEVMHRFLHLPVAASRAASAVDRLQYVEFAFFWVIGAIVIAVTAGFCLRYRTRGAVRAVTPEIHSPVWLEVGVSVVLLASFVLFWVVGFRQYVDAARAPENALDVYVTGRQWVWKFGYADGPASTGVLYVPVNRPIRLLLTSRDVIHSLFVPALRLKRDAVPGRYNSAWFEADRVGRYDILCAEFCGAGHSRMWGEVVVLRPEDFEAWLDGRSQPGPGGAVGEPLALHGEKRGQPTEEDWLQRGLRVATEKGCLRCHTTDGTEHIGPTWQGLWGRRVQLEGGGEVEADAGYLTESMMDPMAKIVAGYRPVMPTYQGQLAPAETAALLELIKRLQEHGIAGAPPGAGVPPSELVADVGATPGATEVPAKEGER